MKKLVFLLIIPFTILLITACDTTEPDPDPAAKGNLYLTSNPADAQIWIDGVNTSQVTPDTINNIDEGLRNVTLKLQDYKDTTIAISITAGQVTVDSVKLVSNFGSVFLTSNPADAQIWIDGVNTSQVTPDTVKNVDVGVHSVTLKLTDYNDTTFTVSVSSGQTSVLPSIVLVSNISTTLFGPVRIYETVGTTAQEPSGLDLSNGMAYGISSNEQDSVDIYYTSNGFLVQSAHLSPNLIRETDFFVGSSGNLFDEEDSPLRNTGTWTESIGDREANYVFLYDHDGHYSKLKIVNWGGGVPGEPAWVEVQWYYNDTQLDNRF